MSDRVIIKLENAGKTYRTGEVEFEALKNVSLEIKEGEYTAIMGPSGSGKSTCMHILGLLDTMDSGSYYLLSQDVSSLSDDERAYYRNKFIGFVFQTFNLLPDLNLLENTALPLFYAGVSERKRLKAAEEALSKLGLKDFALHKPGELSGGQKQRGAIARAIVGSPQLILADEPTGNLDSKAAKDVLDIFDDLHAEGKTIVLITHDALSARRAERKIYFKDGAIINLNDLSAEEAAVYGSVK